MGEFNAYSYNEIERFTLKLTIYSNAFQIT